MGIVDDIKNSQRPTANIVSKEVDKMEQQIVFKLESACRNAVPKGIFLKQYSAQVFYRSEIPFEDTPYLQAYKKNKDVIFSEGKVRLQNRLTREGFSNIHISFQNLNGNYDGFKSKELYNVSVKVSWK